MRRTVEKDCTQPDRLQQNKPPVLLELMLVLVLVLGGAETMALV